MICLHQLKLIRWRVCHQNLGDPYRTHISSSNALASTVLSSVDCRTGSSTRPSLAIHGSEDCTKHRV